MLWLVTFLAISPPPDSTSPAPAWRVATAATSERIDLSFVTGPVRVEVLPLDRLIILHTRNNPSRLAARVAAAAGQICPEVRAEKDRVELRCRTPQLDATLNRFGKSLVLDINELRGLPWRLGPDGPPISFFDPEELGLGAACPGDNAAARGECALKEGRFLEAAKGFRDALLTPNLLFAQVRLGDLALIAGDPQTAVGWYNLGNRVGVYGRLSSGRLCEFDPECITFVPSLDPDPYSMPPLLRDDLVLRWARAQAFSGDLPQAVSILRRRFEAVDDDRFCQLPAGVLCRRILLTAFKQVALEQGRHVLETYLLLPESGEGPVAVELSREAAEMSARLGAPSFGANLLSRVTGIVPEPRLAEHLLRAAELYLMGHDPVRARVILEFAESRALGKALQERRWKHVRKLAMRGEPAVSPPKEDKPLVPIESAAETLAAALGLSARIEAFLTGKEEAPAAAAAAAPAGDGPSPPPAAAGSPEDRAQPNPQETKEKQ